MIYSERAVLVTCLLWVVFCCAAPASRASFCGNRICESGETELTCNADCPDDPAKRAARLMYPSYNTRKATYYRLDGTTEVIDEPGQLKAFLDGALSYSVLGTLSGGNHLDEDRVVILDYRAFLRQLDFSDDLNCEESCQESVEKNQHEDWYAHSDGAAAIKANRLYMRCEPASVTQGALGSLVSDWADFWAGWCRKRIENQPWRQGVFIDSFGSRVPTDEEHIWRVEKEPHVVSERTNILKLDHALHVPDSSYPCKNEIDIFRDGNYAAELAYSRHDNESITLLTALPAGTLVEVDYTARARIPQALKDDWDDNLLYMVRAAKQSIGDSLLIGNGLTYRYQERHEPFLEYLDGGATEDFAYTGYPEKGIVKQIEYIRHLSELGKLYLAVSGGANESQGVAEVTQRALFVFATYLLARSDYFCFYFPVSPSSYQSFAYFEFYKTRVGEPLEQYRLRETVNGINIYQREFQNALVLVNLGDNPQTAVIHLEEDYRLLNGIRTRTAMLGPKTGTILIKPDAAGTDSEICAAACILGADNPRLDTLRLFRDRVLAQSPAGNAIIRAFYAGSGRIAALLDRYPALKTAAAAALSALVPVLARMAESRRPG